MQELLKVFWDIALWRRGPRDLPASRALLAAAALSYLATSAVQSLLVDGPTLAVARGVADLCFTAAVFWLCLAVGRRGHRLLQTLTAVLGTGTLLALPMIALFLLAAALGQQGPVAGALKLLLLPLLIWDLCVLAHIVRLALEAPLVTGVAIATTYYLVGYLFIERLLPATVG
jgi:hypothetical protein